MAAILCYIYIFHLTLLRLSHYLVKHKSKKLQLLRKTEKILSELCPISINLKTFCRYMTKQLKLYAWCPVAVLTRGYRGLSPPNPENGFRTPKFQGWYIIYFAGVVTLTELTGSAVATCEANEATASVKFVASVKIQLATSKRQVFPHNKSTLLFPF